MTVYRGVNGFPIFATEVFKETGMPTLVNSEALEPLLVQMATQIATTGSVRVMYKYPNGNAYIIKYWVNTPKHELNYAYQFFNKANDLSDQPVDLTYNLVDKGMTFVAYNSKVPTPPTFNNSITKKPFPVEHRIP